MKKSRKKEEKFIETEMLLGHLSLKSSRISMWIAHWIAGKRCLKIGQIVLLFIKGLMREATAEQPNWFRISGHTVHCIH